MPNKKNTPLPFLLIVGFSLVVMLAVVVAQYRSQNGISQLRNGNTQALVTFKVDNWLDEIVNETYVMEDEAKKFIVSGSRSSFNTLQQAIQNLDKENAAIEKLAINEDSTRKAIAALTSLVQKKSSPYRLLQLNAADTVKKNVLTLINAESATQLTDSIYVTALKIQLALGKSLENTIVENEALSSKVLSFSWIMGFISITAIAILASIIIRRLLQNYKLIKALDKAKTEAEKASDIKEKFLANMSHEIRTPVNSVLGFTNLLEKTSMEGNQAQFVSMIKIAGENLLSVINDILDLSKIESGMLQFTKKPFGIKKLCDNVEMMFYHLLNEKQLLFKCIIENDVPHVVVGDKERLNQVLMNLVNNAIKFTEKGEIVLYISVIKMLDNKVQLKFSVKDSGIGIREDKLNAIFERFEQAEASTTRKYGGTGLGLSIVKTLVNLQGGSIIAKSELGQGAEFIFDLEFDLATEEIPIVEHSLTLPVKRSEKKKLPADIKVLVAEDNKMNRRLLEYIFDSWGIKYQFAETGIACINLLKEELYDLVLMDIQMPEMDGYEAAVAIRQQLKINIPIIAMTANVLPGEKEKCEKLGMDDYLPKPISEESLYKMMVKYLPTFLTDAGRSENLLIDFDYLDKTFGGNKPFIQKMVEEFYIQFPKELAGLKQAMAENNIALVKSRSHHLKTTLSTVNKNSFLLTHLEEMEKAEATIEGWQMVMDKINILNSQQLVSI